MLAQLARRRPSASLVISLIALFVALGDSGQAATVRSFILGRTNDAARTSGIAGRLHNQVLAVTNTGTGPAASFSDSGGAPPFTVNSATEISKLNAALVDGQSAADFWNLTGNAGTNPAKDFLGTTDKEPLVVGADSNAAVTIEPGGQVGINDNSPHDQLDVVALDQSNDAILGINSGGTAVEGESGAGSGVYGSADSGTGVEGQANAGVGVQGLASTGIAVQGVSSGVGVQGDSTTRGVIGSIAKTSCPIPTHVPYAVGGCAPSTDVGVFGSSTIGTYGDGIGGIGAYGDGAAGVVGVQTSDGCAPSAALLFYADCGVVCPLDSGVTGCAAADGFGVIGEISHPAGGATASAIEAVNMQDGDLFLGVADGKRVARIDGSGRGFFDGGTENGGADYADAIAAAGAAALRPGDVLAIDPSHPGAVELASSADSTLVAGVYSTKPAVLGLGSGSLAGGRHGRVPVALVGVVPTRVSTINGAVEPGDLLTSSSIPGYAMVARPTHVAGVALYPTGTIIGKALQPLRSGTGLIEVLVTLR